MRPLSWETPSFIGNFALNSPSPSSSAPPPFPPLGVRAIDGCAPETSRRALAVQRSSPTPPGSHRACWLAPVRGELENVLMVDGQKTYGKWKKIRKMEQNGGWMEDGWKMDGRKRWFAGQKYEKKRFLCLGSLLIEQRIKWPSEHEHTIYY